jgi:hypothetical protein
MLGGTEADYFRVHYSVSDETNTVWSSGTRAVDTTGDILPNSHLLIVDIDTGEVPMESV